MKDDDEKQHPWAPVEGIDEEYDDGDEYELVEIEGPLSDEHDSRAEFMIDIRVPQAFWRRVFGCKTSVKVWSPKTGWKLVAKFVSPLAAYEYAQSIAQRLTRLKNAQAKPKHR